MPLSNTFTVAVVAFASAANAFLMDDDCSYFYNLQCTSGDQTTNPPDWAERSFQTYLPGSANYKEEYEGLGRVMCYNNITYSEDRQRATVEAVCRQHSSVTKLEYNWNNQGYTDMNTYMASGEDVDAVPLTVKATDGDANEYTITMEPVNFIWQGATIT